MFSFDFPLPLHLHSLIPRISNLYLSISRATWPAFPVSNIVLTFQFPILVSNFGFTIEAVDLLVSFRLWPNCVILLLWALVVSPMLVAIWMSSVSVISLFFTGVGYQPPAQSPSWRTRKVTLRLASNLRPVRHGWPYQEYKIPADIALGVTETHKPSHRDKVVTSWDKLRDFPLLFLSTGAHSLKVICS